MLIAQLVRIPSEPLYTGIQATGNIKKYQILTNVITILNLPLCFILLKKWCDPLLVFYSTIGVNGVFVFSRLYFIRKLTKFPSAYYVKVILMKCVVPFIIALVPMLILNSCFEINTATFCLMSVIAIIWNCAIFFFLSMTNNERIYIINCVVSKFRK